jgi:hypothetical protein
VRFLGILFVFFGYMFMYAATAAGGKFAAEPWASLFADAYTAGNVPETGTPLTPSGTGAVVSSAGATVGGAVSNVGAQVGSTNAQGVVAGAGTAYAGIQSVISKIRNLFP